MVIITTKDYIRLNGVIIYIYICDGRRYNLVKCTLILLFACSYKIPNNGGTINNSITNERQCAYSNTQSFFFFSTTYITNRQMFVLFQIRFDSVYYY